MPYLLLRKIPRRLTFIIKSQDSTLKRVTRASTPIPTVPALLYNTCNAPYVLSATSTIACASASTETSAAVNTAWPPFSVTICLVCVPPSSLTSLNTTWAPSEANIMAAARPWPLAPPVIKATLPSNLPAIRDASFYVNVEMDLIAADHPCLQQLIGTSSLVMRSHDDLISLR